MTIFRFDSCEKCIVTCDEFLRENEAHNNLVYGILSFCKDADFSQVIAIADIEQQVSAFGILSSKSGVPFVAAYPCPEESQRRFCDYLIEALPNGFSINAESSVAESFAALLENSYGLKSQLKMSCSLYELTKLSCLKRGEGDIQVANTEHLDLIYSWLTQFNEEIGLRQSPDVARMMVTHNLANRYYFLLVVDREPVTMLRLSPVTDGSCRIGSVYTPMKYRKSGYATALVYGALSQQFANGMTHAYLYADQDNPISNGIYQKVGFVEVGWSKIFSYLRSS